MRGYQHGDAEPHDSPFPAGCLPRRSRAFIFRLLLEHRKVGTEQSIARAAVDSTKFSEVNRLRKLGRQEVSCDAVGVPDPRVAMFPGGGGAGARPIEAKKL